MYSLDPSSSAAVDHGDEGVPSTGPWLQLPRHGLVPEEIHESVFSTAVLRSRSPVFFFFFFARAGISLHCCSDTLGWVVALSFIMYRYKSFFRLHQCRARHCFSIENKQISVNIYKELKLIIHWIFSFFFLQCGYVFHFYFYCKYFSYWSALHARGKGHLWTVVI